MPHSIDDIITLITAMRNKALILQHMNNTLLESDRDQILMRNLKDDIRSMARQIVYDDLPT